MCEYHKAGDIWEVKQIKDYLEGYNYKLISDYLQKTSDYIIIEDEFGYKYSTRFNNFRRGRRPPFVSKFNPYTIQNIKLWCRLNNKNFSLISESYKDYNEKLIWMCHENGCNELFEMDWDCVLHGQNCPYCRGARVGLSNCLATKNPTLAQEWNYEKNKNMTPYTVTCGCNKKAWWKCKEGHEWKAIISSRNGNNRNCPYCSGLYPTNETNLMAKNKDLCREWNYEKNKKTPYEYSYMSTKVVWWKCSECGYEWKASIGNRNGINKTGCPQCSGSKGEKSIKQFLKDNNINFKSEHTFEDLISDLGRVLRFDVAITSSDKIKCLIEYDGEYHYKPIKNYKAEPQENANERYRLQLYHDNLKNNYCKLHNILLIRIPYWDFDNISDILKEILINSNIKSEYIINNKINKTA